MKKWKKRCSRRRRSLARNRAQLFDRWVEGKAREILDRIVDEQVETWLVLHSPMLSTMFTNVH